MNRKQQTVGLIVANANDTHTRNRRRQPVPENCYRFSDASDMQFGTELFWYRFSAPISGMCDFWYVCHGHKIMKTARLSVACRLAADIGTRQNGHFFVGVGDDRRRHVVELRWSVGAATRIAAGTCRHSTNRRHAAVAHQRQQRSRLPPPTGINRKHRRVASDERTNNVPNVNNVRTVVSWNTTHPT